MTPVRIVVLVFLAGALILCPGVLALLNPAAIYCTGLNNTYTITTAPGGGQTGTCVLPDKKAVDAWEFLEGRIAQEYSYCHLNNYSIHTVTDADLCAGISSTRCALCVLPDGKEKEVTALMNLTFREPNLVVGTSSCAGDTCPLNPPAAVVSTTAKSSLSLTGVGIAFFSMMMLARKRT